MRNRFRPLGYLLLVLAVTVTGCGKAGAAKLPAGDQPALLSLFALVTRLSSWQTAGDPLTLTAGQVKTVLPVLREIEVRTTLAEADAQPALQRLWSALSDP